MDNNTHNYFGLDDEFSSPENSRVAIVPVPYEHTVSYGRGTGKGPEAVLTASQQVELFDEELWIEPYKIGIQTLAPVKMEMQTGETEKPFQELRDVISPLIEFGKFPIIIGGEHSLSLGSIAACADRYPDLSVLQIDAHADCREAYEGNPYSHASVSYHIYKGLPNPVLTQVGIRNISAAEVAWLEEEKPNINIFWARQQEKWNFHEMISTLSDNVYLTIDIDGLDASIMPSTGTPEPGGMTWYQLIELVKLLCVRKNVVAADIVELAPIPQFHGPDFLVAKLIYKIIGYKFALDLGVTKKYL
jgi:agmatinase